MRLLALKMEYGCQQFKCWQSYRSTFKIIIAHSENHGSNNDDDDVDDNIVVWWLTSMLTSFIAIFVRKLMPFNFNDIKYSNIDDLYYPINNQFSFDLIKFWILT